MIEGGLAIFLNGVSIAILSSMTVVMIISAVVWFRPTMLSQHPEANLRKILWFLVFSPWFIGVSTAVIIMLSTLQNPLLFGVLEQLHWHHENEFIISSWHGISAIIAFGYIIHVLVTRIMTLRENERKIDLLNAMSEKSSDGYYKLESGDFAAFTAGYLNPKYYISSALKSELSDRELIVLKAHEDEHIKQSDPLKKWAFQLLVSFFPKKVSSKLNRMMILAVEQCADMATNNQVNDKKLVAMTLLKVRRLLAKTVSTDLNKVGSGNANTNDHFEQRITYLLTDNKSKAVPLVFMSLIFCMLFLLSTWSVDTFHHLLDISFSH